MPSNLIKNLEELIRWEKNEMHLETKREKKIPSVENNFRSCPH